MRHDSYCDAAAFVTRQPTTRPLLLRTEFTLAQPLQSLREPALLFLAFGNLLGRQRCGAAALQAAPQVVQSDHGLLFEGAIEPGLLTLLVAPVGGRINEFGRTRAFGRRIGGRDRRAAFVTVAQRVG